MWTKNLDGDLEDGPDPAKKVDPQSSPEPEQIDERQQMLDAMEEHYDFPGEYKIVVIAKSGEGFRARLIAHLEIYQAGADYDLRERPSRKGNYIAYHLRIHVVSAEVALERKHTISLLEGVHVML